MFDSVDFYNAAFKWQQVNLSNNNNYSEYVKTAYLQIITTVFYELTTKRKSPLLSEMCAVNGINFSGQNFQVEKINVCRLSCVKNSFDMYCIFQGLNIAFSENLDACSIFFEKCKPNIFSCCTIDKNSFKKLIDCLTMIDMQLKKFLPQAPNEEKILLQELNFIAKNRISDDEKIIAEIIKIQAAMQNEVLTIQNSLKQISEIRDGLDFRTLREPIYQLIQLYEKFDSNLKRHPMEDTEKGYRELIRRCNSFLRYIVQSLEMLGVELINTTGGIFDPDKHKVVDDENFSLDSTVTKINKIGFIYKGKILEKAEVEVAKNF